MKYTKIREESCKSHNRTLFNDLFSIIRKRLQVEPFHAKDGSLDDLLYINFQSNEPVKFIDRDGRRGIVFPVKSHGSAMDNIVVYEDGATITIEGDLYHYHHDVNVLLAKLASSIGHFKEYQSVREHEKMVKRVNNTPIQYVD